MAKVFLRAYDREIETMIDRGQLDEAIAHCHHILKTFPKHLETYRLLGKAYLEGKRYGDAVDIFSRILAAVPSDFVAQVGMSIIRDEENKLDDAIWHMERAFETQPSNSAIQGELQRLYGRRDGVQPPRIRMTRGALAHMYLQGELYPQAISEIKSVLGEDPGRSDMQALLARTYFKSGAKNDAVDASLALLQRNPYSLDANCVLFELLTADRNENAQSYRQRVVELDPYAAQVTGSIFLANEVSDAAVNLDRLDWNGQPVGAQSEWRENKAISLESGAARNEEPDWLKSPFGGDVTPPPSQPTTGSMFDTPASSSATPAQPADAIPDFLKAAGWGESTGMFDESKPAFSEEEPASSSQPLAQGDLPDWIKAMKPAEPEPATPEQGQEEELPDWIENIGKGALSTAAVVQPGWANQPEQVQQPITPPSNDQPDWMKGFEQQPAQASEDQPDWLKGPGESNAIPQPAQTDTPDWLKGLGNEPEPTASTDEPDWLKGLGESDTAPQPAQTETPDWLKGLGNEPESTPAAQANDLSWLDEIEPEPAPTAQTNDVDWLKQLGAEPEPAASESKDLDFLNELTREPVVQTPEATNVDDLGKSAQEQDDSFAWLENLAAKQGASEGLLTKPEERLEQEPEWVRQAKGLPSEPVVSQPPANIEDLGKSAQEQDDSFAWLENLAAKQGASEGLLTKPEERLEQEPEWVKQAKGLPSEPVVSQPPINIEELGKSAQEQDDSFAWLENLAAKQGASEGLLTKPEERLEQEPEWVKQAKGLTSAPAVSQPPANIEELGKSAQEQDDSFAWLESLAAKQGASEGLLTKPEERLEQEPEWVKQAKDFGAQQPAVPASEPEPVMEQPTPTDETPVWLKEIEAEEQQPVPLSTDETPNWLKNLDEEEQLEPSSTDDQTSLWLKSLDQPEAVPSQPAAEPVDADMPAWMRNIEQEEVPASEPAVPAREAIPSTASELPSWLNELDRDEKVAEPSNADDLPAWLRDETGELIAEPAKIEPTRSTDWKPVDESKQPEIIYSPPLEEPKEPEIVYSPPLEETRQPELEKPLPPASFESPLAEPVAPPPQEKQQPEPRPARKTPSKPKPAVEPYKEPPTRIRGTGMLVMPGIDPTLGAARSELSRSNIPGALESYGKLIKRGRFLDEVIYDLREALYRYPVEVSIWQSLGDAYMRANRLQDALDAYTKAEELLR